MLALVEVKARFDEANNIVWARKLEKAGVHVVYGLVGLKTHCKLVNVIREEDGVLRSYSHIGTGNYNPKTSRIYEDFGLFTSRRRRSARTSPGCSTSSAATRSRRSSSACSSPRCTCARGCSGASRRSGRTRWTASRRTSASRSTRWSTRQIIDALYRASAAGVPVEVWVRGICSLRSDLPGVTDNITVRSILGRYLEHSRIFAFHNDGDPQVFIGSADMMHRNLDRRVEALVRVTDPAHVDELLAFFDLALSPETTSWHLGEDGEWTRRAFHDDGTPLIDLQDRTMSDIQKRRRARAVR